MTQKRTQRPLAGLLAMTFGAALMAGCTYELPSLSSEPEAQTQLEPVGAPVSSGLDPIYTGSVQTPDSGGNVTVVQVRDGDSLKSIARSHDLDWRDLADANKIDAPYRLSTGQTLVLPSKAR